MHRDILDPAPYRSHSSSRREMNTFTTLISIKEITAKKRLMGKQAMSVQSHFTELLLSAHIFPFHFPPKLSSIFLQRGKKRKESPFFIPPRNKNLFYISLGSPGDTSGKESTCQCRRHGGCGFNPWVRKIPWRRAWPPTPVFLPGEFHGQKSLESYSQWRCQELDTTEQLTLTLFTCLLV